MSEIKENTVEINKEKRGDLLFVDPRAIIADESFNRREDYGDIDELALSIVEHGVKVPLRGRRGENNTFSLTDGFRRMRAVLVAIERGAEIARVPFILEPKGYKDSDRLVDMFTLNNGKQLTAIEQGRLFADLERKFNFTRKEIAKKTGKFESYISNMIALVDSASDGVKELINQGKISATTVAQIVVKEKDTEKVDEIVANAVEKAEKAGKKKAANTDVDVLKKSVTKTEKNSDILLDWLIQLESDGIDSKYVDFLQKIHDFVSTKAPYETVKEYVKQFD